MADRPKIKILVSCHKPVVYPKSELFLPVHVGAEGKTPIAGMQPDNEGENISDRNFTYCELTAQYWAWKNLDADYVGQCHYRRYFCFDGQKHKANDHKQIEEECLSQYTINKYHIEDEAAIRSVVESHDLVTAPRWNVLGAVTPDGTKKTIRGHMVGYGLMADEDVDCLIGICRDKQPEYVDDLVSYLNGSKYLGYNCFIMKRELFDRLCEFEFSILKEFDKQFDYSGKTVNRKRICGYFGEILYSTFVSHIKKAGNYSFAEAPLVFFENTPTSFVPSEPSPEIVDIVWRYPEPAPAKLAVAVRSLANSLDQHTKYRLTVLHDSKFNEKEFSILTPGVSDNLLLRFETFPAVDSLLFDRSLSDSELHILLPFLLPGMIAQTYPDARGKLIWIEGCAVCVSDPATLLSQCREAAFSAMRGVYLEKELNKPFNAALRSACGAAGESGLFDSSIMVIDLDRFARDCAGTSVVDLYREVRDKLGADPAASLQAAFRKFSKRKLVNGNSMEAFMVPTEVLVARSMILSALGCGLLPLEVAYPVVSVDEAGLWSNAETLGEWNKAKPGCMLSYKSECNPLTAPTSPLCSVFWDVARTAPSYETLVLLMVTFAMPSLKDRLFPPYSRRRRFLGRVNGFVHRFI